MGYLEWLDEALKGIDRNMDSPDEFVPRKDDFIGYLAEDQAKLYTLLRLLDTEILKNEDLVKTLTSGEKRKKVLCRIWELNHKKKIVELIFKDSVYKTHKIWGNPDFMPFNPGGEGREIRVRKGFALVSIPRKGIREIFLFQI